MWSVASAVVVSPAPPAPCLCVTRPAPTGEPAPAPEFVPAPRDTQVAGAPSSKWCERVRSGAWVRAENDLTFLFILRCVSDFYHFVLF